MTNYEEIGREIGKLVAEKNKSYGDSFRESGKIIQLLYPNGIPVEKYTSVLALIRILDKIQRLVTDPSYNGENSWGDIAGYAILMLGYGKEKMVQKEFQFRDPMRIDEKTSGPVETCILAIDPFDAQLRDAGIGG